MKIPAAVVSMLDNRRMLMRNGTIHADRKSVKEAVRFNACASGAMAGRGKE
jgi:hypothetical protein